MPENKKYQSGLSTELLKVQAEALGKTLIEVICKQGLPNDVSFEHMLHVLRSPSADREFKKYVLSQSNEIAHTDEELESLQPFNAHSSKKSTFSKGEEIKGKASNQTFIKSEIIDADTLETIHILGESLSLGSSTEKKKEVVKELDNITNKLLGKAGNDLCQLAHIYSILPRPNRRIPYLNQTLYKLAKIELRKGGREKIEEIFLNEKFDSLRQKLGLK